MCSIVFHWILCILQGGEVVMFLNEKRDTYLTVVKRTVDTSVGIEEDVTADTHHSTFTKEGNRQALYAFLACEV